MWHVVTKDKFGKGVFGSECGLVGFHFCRKNFAMVLHISKPQERAFLLSCFRLGNRDWGEIPPLQSKIMPQSRNFEKKVDQHI